MDEETVQELPKQAGQSQNEPQPKFDSATPALIPPWNPSTGVLFRFCFSYFILFSFANQMVNSLLAIPGLDMPDLGTVWPLRQMTFWVAKHVFRVTHPLVYIDNGSGDKTFNWVETFCLLMIAVVVTAVWSILARRKNYDALHKWFRLFVRLGLVSQMFLYGFIKVMPVQMSFPSLPRLVEPYGNFAPMSLLWCSVGASPTYEKFAGGAELLGGVLLLFPVTTTLGALVCLADLTQVFVLNMTYDVPVKLFSFHLWLLALFLLVPHLRRLVRFFFTRRSLPPSAEPPLFGTRRANRIGVAAQVLFGFYLMAMTMSGTTRAWRTFGGARPKSALYGIWDVEQMSIDGQIRPPLLTDPQRWRRVIFDFTFDFTDPIFFFADSASFQNMDERFADYSSSIDEKAGTLTLKKRHSQDVAAQFSFSRPAHDQLLLDGFLDGHKIQAQLKLLDLDQLMLIKRGFHWVTEYPFLER
jgi:uncharacterized membrane protein YphA (DoxX/SURF4 family)